MRYVFAHLNCRSLLPSFDDVRDLLNQHNFTILALTETWLNEDVDDADLHIDGYVLLRKDRGSRGGGVAFYLRENLCCKIVPSLSVGERLWVNVKLNGLCVVVGVAYRPPSTSVADFIDDLEMDFSQYLPVCDELFCLGDFNIDVLDLASGSCARFSEMCDAYSIKQIVDKPTRLTRSSATAIDLILTTNTDLVADWDTMNADNVSDHELIFCNLNLRPISDKETFKIIRDFRNFDIDLFLSDFFAVPFHKLFYFNDVDTKVDFFTKHILCLFEVHAPFKKVRSRKKFSPWLTSNTRLLMSIRDEARVKWKCSRSPIDYDEYKNLRNFTARVIKAEKRAYLNGAHGVGADGGNVWTRLRRLGVVGRTTGIPNYLADADDINDYFVKSVPRLDPDLDTLAFYNGNCRVLDDEQFSFYCVSQDIIDKAFRSLRGSSAGSDGLSYRMLEYCYPHIIPYVSHIINFCIEKSVFPSEWRKALVTPIPKVKVPKHKGDLRPISVLCVLSKLLEKILKDQINEFINKFSLIPVVQSAFRPRHSCETALLHVVDDIVSALDKNHVTILILLDYSKAFDSINHQTLLSVLRYTGFGSGSLSLIFQYLFNRSQLVSFDGTTSAPLPITSGVPQGSILGPLLYSLYTARLPSLLKSCKVHLYADDTQLYFSFPVSDFQCAVEKINDDLSSIHQFARNHSLYLNAKKSKAMLFAPNHLRTSLPCLDLFIDGDRLEFVHVARNLGVMLDDRLSFDDHVKLLLRRSFSALKLIYRNRHFLTTKTKTLLCDTLVLSQFNFCDVLYGSFLSYRNVKRIQMVQNSCLRFICGIRRRERISHRIKEIGWLDMDARRKLHCACMFHKVVLNKTPAYLYNKITFRTDVHNLNLRHRGVVMIPSHRTQFFKKGFSYKISKVYNNLPNFLKSTSIHRFKADYVRFFHPV